MKRFVVALLALAGVALGVGYVLRVPISLWLVKRVVARNLGDGRLGDLPDGLHLGLCGAGSPLPDPERSGPCVAVIAGSKLYVVDSGAGSSRVLARMRLPQGRIDAVFLTHFHSDHIDGLGELLLQRWAGGANVSPVPVYGPMGVERVVAGFNAAYAQDVAYRIAHHGEQVVPRSGAGGQARPFPAPAVGTGLVVLEDGDLAVTTFRVDHRPVEPAVGYRFDYKGRSLVISGDTKKSETVQDFAKGVDLLVHEALSPRLVGLMNEAATSVGALNVQKITADIVDYHTTPVEAAEVARDAAVKHLLLYHIVPPLPLPPLRAVFLEGVAQTYTGPVTLGRDGTFFSLPAASDQIETDELL